MIETKEKTSCELMSSVMGKEQEGKNVVRITFRRSAMKHTTPMQRQTMVAAPQIQPLSTQVQIDTGNMTTAAKIARRVLRRQSNPNVQRSGNKMRV